ncbi:LOW QUALITY PROTEIN: uncharacterized protein LOC131673402 [Phymastichus coffea]|uniref:LOW QUALITY PROTEIN: uncharacterized protein LOC131673402 n=1 Tax=Phymastichus coffea TaxID=108790 RepID=UPI00273C8E6C|nr:LOW QUALITY PROTEIN: uncharacterized protein LOC131673402 [Phymastichus coffea]
MSKICETEIFWTWKYDDTIISYLNLICERYDVRDQNSLIATHGRNLGTFLTIMKRLNPSISDMASCIDSSNWNDTVAAIRIIAGFDKKKRYFESPSTAQLIGLLLKNIINVLKSQYNQTKNKIGYRRVLSFLVEFETHWLPMIGSKIVSSQNNRRKNHEGKTVEEITPNDKNLIVEFLSRRRDILFDKARQKFNDQIFTQLTSVEMIYVQCLNGRRPGENSRTSLNDYKNRTITDQTSLHFKGLSNENKKQALKFSVMNLTGKKTEGLDGRVYLDTKDKKIIDLIVKNRTKFGVCPKNQYLYVTPNMKENEHLNGHEVMKKLVNLCHRTYKTFEQISNVTATGFRKFIATQYKRQTNGQHSKLLIRHLFHTEQTHNKYYRGVLPQKSVAVTHILEDIILKRTEIQVDQDEEIDTNSVESSQFGFSENKQQTKAKSVSRRSWSDEDKADFEIGFSQELKDGRYPT